jgi:hypothetical protein
MLPSFQLSCRVPPPDTRPAGPRWPPIPDRSCSAASNIQPFTPAVTQPLSPFVPSCHLLIQPAAIFVAALVALRHRWYCGIGANGTEALVVLRNWWCRGIGGVAASVVSRHWWYCGIGGVAILVVSRHWWCRGMGGVAAWVVSRHGWCRGMGGVAALVVSRHWWCRGICGIAAQQRLYAVISEPTRILAWCGPHPARGYRAGRSGKRARGARLARLLHGPGMAPSGGPTRIVARAGARRAVKFFSPFGPGRDRPGLPGLDPGHGGPTGPGPGPTDGPSVTLSRGCLKALARSGPGRCVRAGWEGPDRAARRRWTC